jgi:alpha-tubulin suppressor-like RCC1 family protein
VQLGLGGKGKGGGSPRRLEPALVALDKAVATVACGWGHAACVTEAGSLYSWGFNLHGQLGLGDTKSRLAPELVEAMSGVQGGVLNVSCASHMSGALGRDGSVWVWGSAELGR